MTAPIFGSFFFFVVVVNLSPIRPKDEEERELAIIFLQKLIRGKAIQNMASQNIFISKDWKTRNQKYKRTGVAGNANLILANDKSLIFWSLIDFQISYSDARRQRRKTSADQ
jgi:hypothetical protein